MVNSFNSNSMTNNNSNCQYFSHSILSLSLNKNSSNEKSSIKILSTNQQKINPMALWNRNKSKIRNMPLNKLTIKRREWGLLCYKTCSNLNKMRILHSYNFIKWSRNCWKICLILWESIKWEPEKGLESIKSSKDNIVRMTGKYRRIRKGIRWKERRKLILKKFNKMENLNRDKINKDPCHHCQHPRPRKVS